MEERRPRYERLPNYYGPELYGTNFRAHPDKYRIGKGEQGVLMVEPYKSEILPHWRFRTPEVARESSEKIFALFLAYLAQEDFVGADMARKFIQMGFTRSRRYANHKSGRKYARNPQLEPTAEAEKVARKKLLLPQEVDPIKAASAEIFREKYQRALEHPDYQRLMQRHREQYEKADHKPEEGRPQEENGLSRGFGTN
jgi:hypothetical protein